MDEVLQQNYTRTLIYLKQALRYEMCDQLTIEHSYSQTEI